MQVRELPPDEWHRLEGTELEPVWRDLIELSTTPTVIVVEDEMGAIVGCWSLLRTVAHVEGCWIDPSHRKRAVVARHLLTKMQSLFARMSQPMAIAGVTDPEVAELLMDHLGAQELPGQCYAIPTRRK
jgi:hypothetical protein